MQQLSPVPPPEGGRRYVELVRALVGKPVSGIVHSSRVTGLYTHYMGGDTHPCLRGDTVPHSPCIGCAEHAPRRWKGYLMGLSDQTHKPCLFELPAQSCRESLQLRDQTCNLRGAHITVTRCGPNPNSSCNVLLRLDAHPQTRIPSEEPDVVQWLCVIWGLGDWRDEVVLRTEGGHDD